MYSDGGKGVALRLVKKNKKISQISRSVFPTPF